MAWHDCEYRADRNRCRTHTNRLPACPRDCSTSSITRQGSSDAVAPAHHLFRCLVETVLRAVRAIFRRRISLVVIREEREFYGYASSLGWAALALVAYAVSEVLGRRFWRERQEYTLAIPGRARIPKQIFIIRPVRHLGWKRKGIA